MKMNMSDEDVGESRKARGPGQVFSLIWSPVRQTQPTRSRAFQLKMQKRLFSQICTSKYHFEYNADPATDPTKMFGLKKGNTI